MSRFFYAQNLLKIYFWAKSAPAYLTKPLEFVKNGIVKAVSVKVVLSICMAVD